MHCASCAGRVESALSSVEGVTRASVSLAQASATVEGASIDSSRLVAAVRDAGFEASVERDRVSVEEQRTAMERRQSQAAQAWRRRAIVGAAIWLPLEALHWFGESIGLGSMHDPAAPALWISVVLAAISILYVGGAFYRSAFRAARGGGVNMDTLIAIGATAAFGLSALAVIRTLTGAAHDIPMYFAEATALLAIISVGHWLEARTSAAAGSAIHDLLALQPDEVERLDHADDGGGEIVRSADIRPGDLMLVRPGERVAVDGEIVDGASTLDESVVTGESAPVERGVGEAVVAGSLNETGRLVVRATTDGRDTTVARIAEMVRTAQSSKADIQRIADRVVSVFVPVVIAIAAASFVGWAIFGGEDRWLRAVVNATTVLVISCPCALGLAAPTAVMVASGHASRRGILVKSAPALERAAAVDLIMFDKTGTLTRGRPEVILADDEPLRLAASLAAASTHPLSEAIRREVEARGLASGTPARGVAEEAGRGLEGTVDGERIELVSWSAATAASAAGLPEAPPEPSATTSVVLRGGEYVGAIAFRDEPREDARSLVTRIHDDGLEAQLLTGDRREVAAAIAEAVGLHQDEVRAELRPEEKVAAVRDAASSGRIVAMVGDGINDAAALAEAGARGGVGVAMGTGANIAIESADVVIPSDRLEALPELIELSRDSLRTIKQNLFLSFVYNASAIPAAAFGLLGMYGPVIAAIAMGLSDFCVVGNSLRLKWRLSRRV